MAEKTPDSNLYSCEISRKMIWLAEKNAEDYGFTARAKYEEDSCMQIPSLDDF